MTVKDEDEVLVFTGTAPSSVVLKAGGAYFDGYNYSFTFEKDGYLPQVVYLRSKLDPWYFGNILFGGLIGLFIVDPLTGSMLKLPDNVAAVLPADDSIKEGGADDLGRAEASDKEKGKTRAPKFHSGDFPIVAYRYAAATRQGSISVNIEGMGVNARHWLVENIGIICSDKNIALVAGEEARRGARYRVTNECFEDGILTIDFEALY